MPKYQYQVLTPQQACAMLRGSGAPKPVDVRGVAERGSGSIPGSLRIPLDELEQTAPLLLPDRGTPVLVYCQSGARSWQGAQKLCEMGYSRVYELQGGFSGWQLCRAGLDRS